MTEPSPHRQGSDLPAAAIIGMLLAAALAPLGSTMIAVALPRIGQDIGADASDLTQWLVANYLIASIALQSPGGKLGDLIGHTRALTAGLLLVAVGSVIGSAVVDLHALGVARILMASGGAVTMPATVAMLRNQTAPERRARMFGIFWACMGLAAAIGPLVGGELTERFGWRAVFFANVPVITGSWLLMRASRHRLTRPLTRPPTLDWQGSLLLGFGLTLTVMALRIPAPRAWWLAGSGAVLLALFPVWERRALSPVVDFSLLSRGSFFGGGAIIGLQNLAMYSLLFQLPVFFDRVRQLSPRAMGHALLGLTLAMMVSSLAGGRLTESVGARAQTCAGSLIALAGLWWFSDFTSLRGPADVVPGLLLIGAGVGLSAPPAQAAALATVAPDQSGMASGVISTMRYIGGVAGTAVLGMLLRDSSSTAAHQRPVYLYAGALLVAAAMSALLPGREVKPT